MRSQPFGAITVYQTEAVNVVRYADGWKFDDFRPAYEWVLSNPHRRIAIINDVQAIRPGDAGHRQKIVEAGQALASRLDERAVVSMVVTDSMLMRGGIRAVLWFHPMKHPVEPVATLGEAVTTVCARLEAEGIPFSRDSRAALEALGAPQGRAPSAGPG